MAFSLGAKTTVFQKYLLASIVLTVCIAACSPIVETRGHVDQQEVITSLKPGHTKEEVLRLMGSPSSRSAFGSENWYYISSRKENVAFLKPKVVEQRVTQIEFDEAGLVKKVEAYDLKDAKKIDMVSRTTPSEGHSLGVMEQLLGNLGRFNKPKGKGVRTPGKVGRGGY